MEWQKLALEHNESLTVLAEEFRSFFLFTVQSLEWKISPDISCEPAEHELLLGFL